MSEVAKNKPRTFLHLEINLLKQTFKVACLKMSQ